MIERLVFEGVHGAFVNEHKSTQRFQVDIRADVNELPISDELVSVID